MLQYEGKPIEHTCRFGYNVLMRYLQSSEKPRVEVVRQMIQAGVDLEARLEIGQETPFLIAIGNLGVELEVIQLLIQSGG